MPRIVFTVAICALLAACASSGTSASASAASSASSAQQQPRRSGDVVSSADLVSSSGSDLYTALQRLRPQWLQARGTTTFGNTAAGSDEIQVYVDGVHRGTVTALHELSAADAGEVRHLSGTEATQRFGTGNSQGAILVTLKR